MARHHKNDLVDELWLKIHPLTPGKGKKLFEKGTNPAAFTLIYRTVTSTRVIIANYKRAGKVKTGILDLKKTDRPLIRHYTIGNTYNKTSFFITEGFTLLLILLWWDYFDIEQAFKK